MKVLEVVIVDRADIEQMRWSWPVHDQHAILHLPRRGVIADLPTVHRLAIEEAVEAVFVWLGRFALVFRAYLRAGQQQTGGNQSKPFHEKSPEKNRVGTSG